RTGPAPGRTAAGPGHRRVLPGPLLRVVDRGSGRAAGARFPCAPAGSGISGMEGGGPAGGTGAGLSRAAARRAYGRAGAARRGKRRWMSVATARARTSRPQAASALTCRPWLSTTCPPRNEPAEMARLKIATDQAVAGSRSDEAAFMVHVITDTDTPP